MQSIHASQVRPPFYRDERVLGLFSQILVVVLGLGLFFFSNMLSGSAPANLSECSTPLQNTILTREKIYPEL